MKWKSRGRGRSRKGSVVLEEEERKMLVLTRRRDESIIIDGRITVRVLKISGGQIRLGIEAPQNVKVVRTEVLERHQTDSSCEPAPHPSLETLT